MPVHVKKNNECAENYNVITVLITNRGVYLINDVEESWKKNPDDRG